MLANQGGLEPFFDQPLARPRDRVDTGLQGRRNLAVAPALTTLRGVGFQQDPGLQQLLCWMVSAMDKGGEMLSLLIAQCHYVFLYRDLFPGHQSAPSAATEPSSQTNTAESMTGATSPSYSRRWRRRRADFPLMVGCAVARCVCFAAASGLGVGAGGSRGWIAGAMVAPSLMALSASTPPRCGGSTRPLGRQQQRRGGRGKPSRQPARRASKAAGEWC